MKELAQIRIDRLSDLISFGCDGSQEKVNLLTSIATTKRYIGIYVDLGGDGASSAHEPKK